MPTSPLLDPLTYKTGCLILTKTSSVMAIQLTAQNSAILAMIPLQEFHNGRTSAHHEQPYQMHFWEAIPL